MESERPDLSNEKKFLNIQKQKGTPSDVGAWFACVPFKLCLTQVIFLPESEQSGHNSETHIAL